MISLRSFSASLLLLPLILLLLSSEAYAASDTFYYKSKGGVKHYTNIKPSDGSGYSKIDNGWDISSHRQTYSLPSGSPAYPDIYDKYIGYAASVYDLDPDLIKAVIKVESNFNRDAVSPKGAMGVMQLMPGTAEMLGVKRPFVPSENIMGGSKYLSYLLDLFNGNTTLALAGYNAGENAVIRYNRSVPPFPETQDYVKKVNHHYRKIKQSGGGSATYALADPNDSIRKVEQISYREKLDDEGESVQRSLSRSKVTVESVHVYDADGRVSVKRDPVRTSNLNNAEGSGSYTVQVASFSEQLSAKEFKESLLSSTIPAYVEEAQIPGRGTWYRVKVGEFATKGEALSYAQSIKSRQPAINSFLVTARR